MPLLTIREWQLITDHFAGEQGDGEYGAIPAGWEALPEEG